MAAETEVVKPAGFDLRVHIKDPKTGKMLKFQPYRLVVTKEGQYYVRDGKRYNADGSLIGTDEQEAKPVSVKRN